MLLILSSSSDLNGTLRHSGVEENWWLGGNAETQSTCTMAGSDTPRQLPPSYSQLFPESTSLRSPSPVRQCDSPVQRQYAPPLDPFQGGVYCAPSPQSVIARQPQQEYLLIDRNATCGVQSPVQTFVGQFALAIFTCLCCGGCFGLLALILVGMFPIDFESII
jgi:hypothetical protein